MAEMSESTKALSDRNRIRVRRKRKKKPGSGDFMLTSLVLGLTVFGLIMVFSASYYTAINNLRTQIGTAFNIGIWIFILISGVYLVFNIIDGIGR